jgi:hypothetical protein
MVTVQRNASGTGTPGTFLPGISVYSGLAQRANNEGVDQGGTFRTEALAHDGAALSVASRPVEAEGSFRSLVDFSIGTGDTFNTVGVPSSGILIPARLANFTYIGHAADGTSENFGSVSGIHGDGNADGFVTATFNNLAGGGTSSLERMLSLLDVFSIAAPAWSTEDLIRFSGASRSTCYRYVQALQRAGLLTPVAGGAFRYFSNLALKTRLLLIFQSFPSYETTSLPGSNAGISRPINPSFICGGLAPPVAACESPMPFIPFCAPAEKIPAAPARKTHAARLMIFPTSACAESPSHPPRPGKPTSAPSGCSSR